MKKKIGFIILGVVLLFLILFFSLRKNNNLSSITGTVVKYSDNVVTIKSDNNDYTFNVEGDLKAGDYIKLYYTGILKSDCLNCEVKNFEVVSKENSTSNLDIFKDYYDLANNKLKTLSTDEKIGQLLLVRYPSDKVIEDLKKYNFAGFVFYAKDFKDKSETDVKKMIYDLQKNSKIPLLTAVDEEGGKVVRVSSNKQLVSEPFKSPSELYNIGGLNSIKEDTINKSNILYNLGLNLNLAPVLDVSNNPDDYIYDRTLKQNTSITSMYAKEVIEASKATKVSYTLKHFPGYGNNVDTHSSISVDNRSYDYIKQYDLPPFIAGIDAGAEAVLVSHNIVTSIDKINPASLSLNVHNVLRNDLKFTGVIITDDIAMSALDTYGDTTLKAFKAKNNLIITTDYEKSFNSIKTALSNNTITTDELDELVVKVLAWKYYKGLIIENQK